nr:hypothetical protein [Paenibacillus luteus]
MISKLQHEVVLPDKHNWTLLWLRLMSSVIFNEAAPSRVWPNGFTDRVSGLPDRCIRSKLPMRESKRSLCANGFLT